MNALPTPRPSPSKLTPARQRIDPDWRADAACRRHDDPDLWFSGDPYDKEQAKAICAGCRVQPECLHDSISITSSLGHAHIWAGLDRDARARDARARRRRGHAA